MLPRCAVWSTAPVRNHFFGRHINAGRLHGGQDNDAARAATATLDPDDVRHDAERHDDVQLAAAGSCSIVVCGSVERGARHADSTQGERREYVLADCRVSASCGFAHLIEDGDRYLNAEAD